MATGKPLPGCSPVAASKSRILPSCAAILISCGAGERGCARVFVFSACLLRSSGVYHLLTPKPAARACCGVDHAAIFVLIAGSFTPVHAILLRDVAAPADCRSPVEARAFA